MDLTGRLATTVIGTVAALAAAVAGTAVQVPFASGLGWAAVAAMALSLMLNGRGLTLLGGILALLGIAGVVLAFTTTWWFALFFLVVAATGVVMAWRGPSWVVNRPKRPPSEDPWKQMDAGEDPTVE